MVPQAYEDTSLRMIGMAWLFLGISGLIFRAAQLMVKDDMMTAMAWLLKIVSDPFHDLKLYHRAPLYLLRGELIDPMAQVRRL
jgi:hypothetical protein